jgi:mevalonate kinase
MTEASAPGKLILCGEHAVVYGRPAIALPLADVRARVLVEDAPRGAGVRFAAPDLKRAWSLDEVPADPLSGLVVATLAQLIPGTLPDLLLTIRSAIPIAGGMGSGAAIGTALVRALAKHFGQEWPPETISALVYESERGYHGTPSGIDNTVVAFEQAVWFVRRMSAEGGPLIEPLAIRARLTLLVGDTGVRSATRLPVSEVRRRWEVAPAHYEALFDAVGALAWRVRAALAAGDTLEIGPLLDENHTLLGEIGVSSPELERLVATARNAGALGAKLSGAGWGGVMLALVNAEALPAVRTALLAAGAVRVLETTV